MQFQPSKQSKHLADITYTNKCANSIALFSLPNHHLATRKMSATLKRWLNLEPLDFCEPLLTLRSSRTPSGFDNPNPA
jgi:hypothetical protein